MKIKLYKQSGVALVINDGVKQNETGFSITITGPANYVEVDNQTCVLKNGCAKITHLERGNHRLSIYGDRKYPSIHISVEDDVVRVISNDGIEAILDSYEKFKEEQIKTIKKLKEIEERISGYSLFGD